MPRTFATVRALRGLLERNGDGLVVNMSSIAAYLAVGSNMMCCASEAAVDTLTKSLALAAPRVRVVPVSPGLMPSEAAKGHFEPGFLEAHISRTPLAHLTTPRDILATIVAVATITTAVTGIVIPGDAGHVLNQAAIPFRAVNSSDL